MAKYVDFAGLSVFKSKNDELYATKDNAELTGTPVAPTAATGTNTIQLATTAFVQQEIRGITSALVFKGSVATVAGLPALAAGIVGHVYNFTTEAETTADFVEGAGQLISAGANVACIDTDTTGASPEYKWDILGGVFDTTTLENEIASKLSVVTSLPTSPSTGDVVLYNGSTTSDTYSPVTPAGTENPSTEGWYEADGAEYVLSEDTSVDSSKTYYTLTKGLTQGATYRYDGSEWKVLSGDMSPITTAEINSLFV